MNRQRDDSLEGVYKDDEQMDYDCFQGISPPSTIPTVPSPEIVGNATRHISRRASNTQRKRRKPTLNCGACVERKTKCDRARPTCISCLRRETHCQYTAIADIRAATDATNGRPRKRKDLQSIRYAPPATKGSDPLLAPRLGTPSGFDLVATWCAKESDSKNSTTKDRLAPPNLNGMGSRHPFANFWTFSAGLGEVVDILTSREDVDPLVEKYFENVDPLYPIVPRSAFLREHDRFWSLDYEGRCAYDAAQLALQLIIYASGAQYAETLAPDARANSAELYLSACHQALCIFSYMNRSSIPTMQAMLLVSHFLLNNNRISDAWAFSGITQRQAYGLGLNRDPTTQTPLDSFAENQLRCRLWQATMFQDVSLSLYLEMPPSTVYHDIQPTCLKVRDDIPHDDDMDSAYSSALFPSLDYDNSTTPHDISFLRAMWEHAAFVQTNMCIPKALHRPLCSDPMHKTQLITRLRDIYRSWDEPFNSDDPNRFERCDGRLARQVISSTSNYFYAMAMLCLDTNEQGGVTCDVFGALHATHEALAAFFALLRLNPNAINTWCAANTRAYAQSTMIGEILTKHAKQSNGILRDARVMLARSDLERYLDVLIRADGTAEFNAIRQKRITDLDALRTSIKAA